MPETRVLVIGSGIAFSACVRSCLHSGIKHLSIIKTAEEELSSGIASVIDDSRFFHPRDASQHIQELPFAKISFTLV